MKKTCNNNLIKNQFVQFKKQDSHFNYLYNTN